MQRIILESAPEFIFVCILVGLGYAAVQYFRTKHPWSRGIHAVLFTTRAVLAFFLAFLLLGPIVKQISNLYEKPAFVVLYDNSSSIAEAADSAALHTLGQELDETRNLLAEKGYDAHVHTLSDEEVSTIQYTANTSDINGALKRIA